MTKFNIGMLSRSQKLSICNAAFCIKRERGTRWPLSAYATVQAKDSKRILIRGSQKSM